MMLGLPNLVQRDLVDTWPLIKRNFVGVFVQDDFRVNRKLSLQLGLRWDLMTPPVQVDNRQSNFDPTDGLIHVASADNRGPDRKTQYGYIAPRLGLAYSPDNGKTAVRAAFGISYFADNFGASGGTSERNYPFFFQVDITTPTTFTPFRTVSDGFPTVSSVPLSPTIAPPPGSPSSTSRTTSTRTPRRCWNVGRPARAGLNTVVDVSYVGTRGSHIFRSFNVNVPLPGPGNVQQRRPYFSVAPGITTINQRDGAGKTWYNALQVKVDKRFSHGLQALLAYTYSKTEDNIATLGIHPTLEIRQRAPERQREQDAGHPADPLREPQLRAALRQGRGWSQGRGAGRLDGQRDHAVPQRRSARRARLRLQPQRRRRQLAGRHVRSHGQRSGTPQQWLDTSCFKDPAQFQFGNYQYGDVRGPTVFNTGRLALQADEDREDGRSRDPARRVQRLQPRPLLEPEPDLRHGRVRHHHEHAADPARGALGVKFLF